MFSVRAFGDGSHEKPSLAREGFQCELSPYPSTENTIEVLNCEQICIHIIKN